MQGHLPTPPGPHIPIGLSPFIGYVATREPSPLEDRDPEPREWWEEDDELDEWGPRHPPVVRVTAAVLALCLVVGGLGISSFGGRQSIGHLLFLTADCLWAGYMMAIRRTRLDGLHAAAIAAVVSLLVYLPLYLTFVDSRLLEVSAADLAGQALYQGVVAAAVSLALFGRAIILLGASNAAAFVALTPVMVALMAIPALGEWPTSVDWLAIGVITAGVYLASGAPVPRRGENPAGRR